MISQQVQCVINQRQSSEIAPEFWEITHRNFTGEIAKTMRPLMEIDALGPSTAIEVAFELYLLLEREGVFEEMEGKEPGQCVEK